MNTKLPIELKKKSVDAYPVKNFFVDMLTRDITLEDAILDLLDNCVDGILRTVTEKNSPKPYTGYWADIKFDQNSFNITDNCCGIPAKLWKYAFKMGSETPERPEGSLGAYGIGMKRAIFKMGKEFSVVTRIPKLTVEFKIDKDWIEQEENWKIPLRVVRGQLEQDGTRIEITNLRDVITKTFGEDKEKFESDLKQKIENQYAFIISKGFRVTVNGKRVPAHVIKFAFADGEKGVVQPYIFTAQEDGMRVFLTVGFTGPLLDEDEQPHYSPRHSGWSIVCNDRTVLYADKSVHTGWGWGGVPVFHPQYNPIAGVVEFHSDDPKKLPTTTTKNGVDLNSPIYIRVLDKMREGVRPFIDYTNKWKGDDFLKKGKAQIENAGSYDFEELKKKVEELTLSEVHRTLPGRQYKPNLPFPPKKEPEEVRISFKRKSSEVKKVSEYLFGREDKKPAEVGERCFVEILKEARK